MSILFSAVGVVYFVDAQLDWDQWSCHPLLLNAGFPRMSKRSIEHFLG
jgi:hypothetical protein